MTGATPSTSTTSSSGPRRVPAVSRVRPPAFGGLSDGTKQSRAWRYQYTVLADGHTLEFTYANFYNSGGQEADTPNAITVYSAIEWPSGSTTVVPITTNGGVVLQPGEQRRFTVPLEVTVGAVLWIRTQVSVATPGQRWPLGAHLYLGGEGYLDTSAAPSADVTTSTAVGGFTYGNDQPLGPAAITVLREGAAAASVLLVGTSVTWGIGNTTGADKSWASEALVAANIPHMNMALPSSSAGQWSSLAYRRRRLSIAANTSFTHAIWEHGTNDLDGTTLATFQGYCISGWKGLAVRGIKVLAATVIPKTNAGNTTPTVGNTARIAYNAWLRDGAPMSTALAPAAVGATGSVIRAGAAGHPLAGFLEMADKVETARDSGLWQAGMTTDGIHPTAAGHTALQAAVDLSKLTV